jgi:N-methylhydantoinase A
VLGSMRKPPRHTVSEGQAEPPKEALRTKKDVFFRTDGFVSTPVFKRASLRSGNRVNGPALIEEHASTAVVQPGDVLTVDGFGNLQILIGSERK